MWGKNRSRKNNRISKGRGKDEAALMDCKKLFSARGQVTNKKDPWGTGPRDFKVV